MQYACIIKYLPGFSDNILSQIIGNYLPGMVDLRIF